MKIEQDKHFLLTVPISHFLFDTDTSSFHPHYSEKEKLLGIRIWYKSMRSMSIFFIRQTIRKYYSFSKLKERKWNKLHIKQGGES